MQEHDRDALTGLFHRRAFIERLKAAMAEAQAHHRPLSVANVDPDRLYAMNQEHGWQGGDRWLIDFAVIAQRCLSTTDMLARYSGGDFFVLLPGTDADSAAVRLSGLCDAVAKLVSAGVKGEPLTTTVSIGVAELPPGTVNVEEMVVRAFGAKHMAKRCGGGCVKVADPAGR